MIRSENTLTHVFFKSISERIIHILKFLNTDPDYKAQGGTSK